MLTYIALNEVLIFKIPYIQNRIDTNLIITSFLKTHVVFIVYYLIIQITFYEKPFLFFDCYI